MVLNLTPYENVHILASHKPFPSIFKENPWFWYSLKVVSQSAWFAMCFSSDLDANDMFQTFSVIEITNIENCLPLLHGL